MSDTDQPVAQPSPTDARELARKIVRKWEDGNPIDTADAENLITMIAAALLSTPSDVNRARAAAEEMTRASLMRMALVSIAKDGDLECRCGAPPYTDGELCPKCTAIQALDFTATDVEQKERR